MHYQIQITKTGKSYRAQDEYHIFDTETVNRDSIIDVQNYLIEHYGLCKRTKMYRDNPIGEPIHCGWIYCFNNADMSHNPVEKWRQQDWVIVVRLDSYTVTPGEYS